jgi:hypothetical protein
MRSPFSLVTLVLLALPATVLAQTNPQTASLSRTLRQGAEPQPGKQLIGTVWVQASDGEPEELLSALVPRAIEEAADSFKWK